ncbi:RNA polymerase sigma factor RpoD/SigA, partial [candidate division WOR-3 bacterium]|nr:RNA polymerase sigma factor RpoD/SigA [candidate division WOR-3 bacterium]
MKDKKESKTKSESSHALPAARQVKYLPSKDTKSHLPAKLSIVADTYESYLEDVRKEKMLTPKEEIQIGKKIKYGDLNEKREAVNKLVRANLRFVIKIALSYDREKKMITDLINEGNIGLIKAANKFDPDRGLKFISYAVWWVRQHILHYIISNQRLISIPFNRAGKLRKLLKDGRELGLDIENSNLTVEELAKKLDVSARDIEEAYAYAQKDLSIDSSSSYFSDNMLGFYPSPEEYYLNKVEQQELNKLMKELTDREQLILKMYFGLQDYAPSSFEKIGNELGISRE